MGGGSSLPRGSIPRDRVFVVTGGNSGIGYETSKWIAMLGGYVIIACRSDRRAKEAIAKMKSEFAEEKSKGTEGIIPKGEINVEFMHLDLASLTSVMAFIEAFKTSGKKLHVLLCNAGLIQDEHETTEDENELMFQSNYLGHLLITIKLLPIIQNSGEDLRIVNNSSVGHMITDFDANNIQRSKGNRDDTWVFYGKTKGYQLIQYARACSKYEDIIIRARRLAGCSKAQSEGGASLIDAAVNPKYKGRCDLYISELKEELPKNYTRNRECQETLWKYSMEKLSKYLTEDDMSIFDPKK